MIEDTPFELQDIVDKLRIRASTRRKIGRKPDGKEDRIALTCEQAADEIEMLRNEIIRLTKLVLISRDQNDDDTSERNYFYI